MKKSTYKIAILAALSIVTIVGCKIDDSNDAANSSGGCSAGGQSMTFAAPSTSEETENAQVTTLIETLCDAVMRCDTSLTLSGCLSAMNGEAGRQIWDDLGLEDQENERTAAEVDAGISEGSIVVNEEALDQCLHEMSETCDNEGESVSIGDYNNVENLISEEGACPTVLSTVEEEDL